jgi:transposase
LEEAEIRPHKSRYWLNPPIVDQAAHDAQVAAVCDIYKNAVALRAQGVRVMSTDEKTSIQALAPIVEKKPVRPGQVERREFDYVRNGTVCLTANFDVATGKVVAPTLESTRTEEDFLIHIERTVASDPDAKWVFIVDNLTTHVSESLVRFVAKHDGLEVDLGRKSARGILKNVESRRRFLVDSSHRVRFIYTPKHCSWLNQVEMWFSILARRVLRRGSFSTTEKLCEAILAFIAYFNDVLAHPFRWTFSGKPLAAT